MERMEKQKRFAKKQKQFEIYLEYVRRYSVLKLNWVTQKGYTTELNNIWQDMTGQLNDCGGAVRDATHWKKVFTEWKSHTRRKLKYNKPLNKIEKDLIELTGLTSTAARKRKLEKPLKDKTSPDSIKSKVNKEYVRNDIIIKDEILDDWSDASSTSFMEGEEKVIDRGSDGVRSKTQQKIVGQEKQDVHKNQIATEENQSQADEKSKKKMGKPGVIETSQQSAKNLGIKTMDASVQVNPEPLKEEVGIGLDSLSKALFTLSSAINRYCDIVERRIF